MTLRFARPAWWLFAAVLLLFWPLLTSAQGSAPAVENRPWRGFLWEAVRGSDRVLLLGSIHVGRPHFAALDPDYLLRLLEPQVFVFEANVFDARAAAEATERLALYAKSKPGLEAHLDAPFFARVEKLIRNAGANVEVCCRMKPWMLANTLVVLEAIRAGFHPAYGGEARLFELARATGKSTSEIESVDEQLRLFDEAPEATQIDYLRHTVEMIERGASRKEIERLVGAWERGDAAAMEALAAETARSNRPAERFVYERIIKGRHPKMLAAIEQVAASHQLHLVILGALHYFGPEGLLAMLHERGFAVRRLP